MRRTVLLAIPMSLLLAACADQPEGVAWRVPCGGTGAWTQGTPDTLDYTFEHDDADRLTLERAVWSNGTLGYTRTSAWEGDVIVHEEYVGADAYTYDATVRDGQLASAVLVDDDGDGYDSGYSMTYTWDGDRMTGWRRDYNSPQDWDVTTTIEYEGAGWVGLRCRDDATCDRYVGEGSYDQPTYVELDLADDGVVEQITTITYDDHDLPLLTSTVDVGDTIIASNDSEYVREPDGTALRWEWGAVPVDPATTLVEHFTLTYDFCD
jgi:hypothetical protein